MLAAVAADLAEAARTLADGDDPEKAVAALLDGLELFGIGYSWAGFQSLVLPFDCAKYRTATLWAPGGPCLRFSVGLEDIEDLKEDLDRGFARLAAAKG